MALEYSPSEIFLHTAFAQAISAMGDPSTKGGENSLTTPVETELNELPTEPYHSITRITQILGVGKLTPPCGRWRWLQKRVISCHRRAAANRYNLVA